MPWSSARQLSFVEAEEALNISCGWDVRLKLSAKKAVENIVLQNCQVNVYTLYPTLWT